MSWMLWWRVSRILAISALGSKALRGLLGVIGVTSLGTAEPSRLLMRVLSCFSGAAGLLVVVLVGLEAFEGFLDATLAQVCWGGADGGWGGPVGSLGGRLGASGGGGGAADWMISKRESLCSSATLVVCVASFSTSAGLLRYSVAVGVWLPFQAV